jgi:hypothetical protein
MVWYNLHLPHFLQPLPFSFPLCPAFSKQEKKVIVSRDFGIFFCCHSIDLMYIATAHEASLFVVFVPI